MNAIDKVVNYFNPQKGYERQAWREQRTFFDAASYKNPNSGWRVANATAESLYGMDRDTVRARARDVEANSDILKGILSSFKRNVIGSGLKLRSKAQDPSTAGKVEELWSDFCQKKNCDVTGRQSMREIVTMALMRKIVDGGILINMVSSGDFIPLQLQLIEVDSLAGHVLSPIGAGNAVHGGVEIDGAGRHIGYHIMQVENNALNANPGKTAFLSSDDCIFYFDRHRPTQVREMSDLAATIGRIRDVNSFMEAVSVKERIAACLSVFIKKVGGSGNSPIGRQATAKGVDYKGKQIEPGMIMEMNPGDDIATVQPAGQGSSAAQFVQLQQQIAGAGLGLGYETISRDMSRTNYSSARQSLIEDNMTYEMERMGLIEDVLDVIFERFIVACILSGKLKYSMTEFYKNPKKLTRHDWVTQAKPWIDPLKEAKANATALSSGQKTLQIIAAESGYDWQTLIDEQAEVQEYAAKKGVALLWVTGNANSIEEKDEEPEGSK